MKLFEKKNKESNDSSDCVELGQVIKNEHEGNRGVELVMGPDGELQAVPVSEVEHMDGVKATQIAKKDYYLL